MALKDVVKSARSNGFVKQTVINSMPPSPVVGVIEVAVVGATVVNYLLGDGPVEGAIAVTNYAWTYIAGAVAGSVVANQVLNRTIYKKDDKTDEEIVEGAADEVMKKMQDIIASKKED